MSYPLEGGYFAPFAARYRCNYVIGSSPTYYDPSHVNYAIADVHNNRSNVLFFNVHLESFNIADYNNP